MYYQLGLLKWLHPLLEFSSKRCPFELKGKHCHAYEWLSKFKNAMIMDKGSVNVCCQASPFEISANAARMRCSHISDLMRCRRSLERLNSVCWESMHHSEDSNTKALGAAKCIEDGEEVWSWGVGTGWEVIHRICAALCLTRWRMCWNETANCIFDLSSVLIRNVRNG